MKKFSLLLSLGVSAFFFACGGDTTENITNNYTSGMEIADKLSDLPKCTADNAGEQYMVKSDADVYVCTGKDWKMLGGETSTDTVYVSGENITCTTEPLADSSGVNILCNDKVIGSILNGSKGERGEQGDDGKDGAGCSVIYQTEESVTIKCGNDKFNMNLNGGGEVITPADDIMFLEELQGVAQKGPFAAGSSVLVHELKGDKNLTKTNRFFDGMITSDDGKYSINNISLASPYALLEANGYYLDEVVSTTSTNSASQIKLYAYTDLSDRKKANINVLTHLEYFRVRELMANSDGTLKLTDAKKQAQKEIFAAFGIDAKNFDASEDLNILGTSDQSAALLAVSVLFMRNGASGVSRQLTLIGQDIAKDGKWDDAALRARIADWADSVDLGLKGSLTLSQIRSNVSGWGNVPDFEKYVRNFWYNEYGLGACDESNKNVVARDTNSKSALYASKYAYAGSNDKKVRFICDEKSKLWRRATDIEKDTAGWGNNFKNGDVRNGQVNTSLVYVYEDGKWRHGTAIDSLMYEQRANGGKACTKSALNDTSTVKVNNLYYVCSAGTQDTAYRWTNTAGNFYNDTYEARTKCSAKTDGDLINGRVNTSKVYACNGTTGWKEITDGLSKTLGGCYTNLIDSVGLYSGTYYVCLSNGWVRASEARINTIHYECKKNGELLKGLVNTDQYYTCDADTFRVETDLVAIFLEKSCNDYTESSDVVSSKNGTKWTCENSKWVWDDNAIIGSMTDIRDSRKYKTTTIATQTWMAENLNYDYNKGTAKSYCYSNSSTNCDKYGRLYLWSAAMDSAGVFTTTGKGCGYGVTCTVASASSATLVRGVCPEGWHLPSNTDWSTLWTAIGGKSTAGTKLKSKSGWNNNGNGEDSYGFSVLPAGYYYNGSYDNAGNRGYFWSSTAESDGNHAYDKGFSYNYSSMYENSDTKGLGLSVRCLKD